MPAPGGTDRLIAAVTGGPGATFHGAAPGWLCRVPPGRFQPRRPSLWTFRSFVPITACGLIRGYGSTRRPKSQAPGENRRFSPVSPPLCPAPLPGRPGLRRRCRGGCGKKPPVFYSAKSEIRNKIAQNAFSRPDPPRVANPLNPKSFPLLPHGFPHLMKKRL